MHEDTVIPDLVLKLQIVGLGGLMLAELPKPKDETTSQLSGGIMSALMSFSKEVHNREIEALTYADRSVIFIPINDFIIVAEISSTVSKENLNRLIQEFKLRAEMYFIGLSGNLSPFEAESILDQIYHAEWLEQTISGLGYERPFISDEVLIFDLDHSNLTYKITQGRDIPDIIPRIINMVNFHRIQGPLTDEIYAGFVMVPVIRRAIFVAHLIRGEGSSQIGMLITPEEKSSKLFRLTKIMQVDTQSYYKRSNNPDLSELMKLLTQTRDHDAEYHEKLQTQENKKLNFLEGYIKDVDKVLPQVILGKKLLIIGSEQDVDETIMGLHVFGEHIAVPHIRWLTGGEDIGLGITGLSHQKLKELTEMKKIPDNIVCVDVNSRKIDGKYIGNNKFVKDLFNRSKNLPQTQAKEIIKNQLYIIVSFAMTGTAYAFESKNELLSSLQDMKISIKDNGQFDLIQKLLESINPWIEGVINEIDLGDVWI